jgi:hypothetical protein
MAALITVASVLVWAIGFVPTAAASMRYLTANSPYCHGEASGGRYFQWPDRHYCVRYCKRGCWRSDPESTPKPSAILKGSLIAVVWPLLLLPMLAFLLARRSPVAVVRADRIAELERELGLDR